MNKKPLSTEFPVFYQTYISLVEGVNIVSILTSQLNSTLDFLSKIPDEKWEFSYAPDKWTFKVSWIHVIDTERVFAYRALRIGRGDTTLLPGFDQNVFVENLHADSRTIDAIIGEYEIVRKSTIALFEQFGDIELSRIGNLNAGAVTTRALGFCISGHELHHLNLARTKYLIA
jgi:hypothetical protein